MVSKREIEKGRYIYTYMKSEKIKLLPFINVETWRRRRSCMKLEKNLTALKLIMTIYFDYYYSFFSAYSNVFVYLRAHQNNKRKFPSTVILPHIFLVFACLSLNKKNIKISSLDYIYHWLRVVFLFFLLLLFL